MHDLGIHTAGIEPFGESCAVVSVAQAAECAVVRVEDHGLHQGIYGRRNTRARRFTAGWVGSVVVAQVLAQEGGVGTLERAGAVNARVKVVGDALAGVQIDEREANGVAAAFDVLGGCCKGFLLFFGKRCGIFVFYQGKRARGGGEGIDAVECVGRETLSDESRCRFFCGSIRGSCNGVCCVVHKAAA